ncbi:MAG: hypothetical protein PHQ54_05655 [Candidatus Omnitrophica bacterium]|nr:hypothetical protein [Candidatus Omnitrophota bacterium]
MIRRVIILLLIIWAVIAFYRKFIASTMEPFFHDKAGKVKFLQR